jgi:hypothetical protein
MRFKDFKYEIVWKGKGDRHMAYANALDPQEEAAARARGGRIYASIEEADAAIDAAMKKLKAESSALSRAPAARGFVDTRSPGPAPVSYGRTTDGHGWLKD